MRSLTLVEAAALLAVAGSVAAAMLPPFIANLHASRLAEPMDGLTRIATRATALAAGRTASLAYPASVELTPGTVPRGEPAADPPGTWDHPTWRLLGFRWDVPHNFSFAFESENGPSVARFKATAHGDLDGDGVVSTFVVEGHSRDGSEPVSSPLRMYREIE
ncbi:MAG TPA: hypothetical protein VF989_15200 [Polyangiaceae bacterium]|jgi:hypothetical protein